MLKTNMTTKLTKDCFKGSKYYYRDSDIDSWLPEKQEIRKAEFNVLLITKPSTFLEVYGENPDTFSLVEIEELIKKESNLLIDGYYNFFPVKSKEGVAVVRVGRLDDMQWDVHVSHLDYAPRWCIEARFFSRNTTSTLSSSDTSLESRVKTLEETVGKLVKIINL